jgi:hypothetical protein
MHHLEQNELRTGSCYCQLAKLVSLSSFRISAQVATADLGSAFLSLSRSRVSGRHEVYSLSPFLSPADGTSLADAVACQLKFR